ncbi:hypothetical protein M8494_17655 [Serratia ureilytica]
MPLATYPDVTATPAIARFKPTKGANMTHSLHNAAARSAHRHHHGRQDPP